jgi:hypothetical protein
MKDAEMDCERVQDRLSEFLEGSLPEIEQAGVTAHVAECLRCKAMKEGLEETLLLLRSLPPRQAPPELLEGIRRRFAQEETPPTAHRKKRFLPAHIKIPLEAAAALLLFFLVYSAQKGDLPKLISPPPAVKTDAGGAASVETPERKVRTAPEAPAAETAPESVSEGRAPSRGDSASGRSARSERKPPRTASSTPAAPRAQASLPAVPAQRVSTAGERVEPPAVAPPPPRIARPAPSGGEVTIEVPAQHRAGLEERIAAAAMQLGGSAQYVQDPPGGDAQGMADAVRVHLPGDAAKPFLAELSKLGTLPVEGMSGWAELSPGAVTEVSAYVVRIRIK